MQREAGFRPPSPGDKQSLIGAQGVSGYVRNRENRRQKCHENRSTKMATIGALTTTMSDHQQFICKWWRPEERSRQGTDRSGGECPSCDYDAVNSHMTDDWLTSRLTYTITCYATYQLMFCFFNLHSSQWQVLQTTTDNKFNEDHCNTFTYFKNSTPSLRTKRYCSAVSYALLNFQ